MIPENREELEKLINNIVDERLAEYHQLNVAPYLRKNSVGNREQAIDLYADRIYQILADGKIRYLTKNDIKRELGIHDSNLTNSIIDCFINKYREQGAFRGNNTARKVYVTLRGVG